MATHLLPGNPPISVELRKSSRARRITLRVSSLDGRVSLTVPKEVPQAEALSFAESKYDWLSRQTAKHEQPVQIGYGARLSYRGQELIIKPGGRGVQRSGTSLLVGGPTETVGARLAGWLKTQARDQLVTACDGYSELLGKPYGRITLRDTRSRWGSCSSRGALMFSWRLVLAPPNILDYVAAHEVAHLAVMNHSSRFWAVVEELYGPCKEERAWLRTYGPGLHRYRFTD